MVLQAQDYNPVPIPNKPPINPPFKPYQFSCLKIDKRWILPYRNQ